MHVATRKFVTSVRKAHIPLASPLSPAGFHLPVARIRLSSFLRTVNLAYRESASPTLTLIHTHTPPLSHTSDVEVDTARKLSRCVKTRHSICAGLYNVNNMSVHISL